MQRQHTAHGQAADQHGVALRAQFVEGGDNARIPIVPCGRDEIGLAAAMAGELAAVHQEAAARQTLGHELQLDGRAAEAVDEQKPGAPFTNREAAINDGHGYQTFATRVMS